MNKEEKKLLVLIDQSGGFSEDWSQKKNPDFDYSKSL